MSLIRGHGGGVERAAAAGPGDGPRSMRDHLGVSLICVGIYWTIGVAYASGAELYVAHPAWLAPAALWLVWPHRRASLRRLQEVVFLYLMLLVLLAVLPVYWDASWVSGEKLPLRLSQTAGALALAAVGRGMSTRAGHRAWRDIAFGEGPLLMALAVIVVHGLALAPMVHARYGTGWEPGLASAGRLGLCLLGAVVAAPAVRERWSRGLIGLVLTAFLACSR